jgi:hypothetical protein
MYDAAAWSLISPVPFNVYIARNDAHITYWNGVTMTQTYARMIAGTTWFNLYYDDSTKLAAFDEYNRLYRSGTFYTRKWDELLESKDHYSLLSSLTNYLVMRDKKFLNSLREKYTPQQALAWFLPSTEYIC